MTTTPASGAAAATDPAASPSAQTSATSASTRNQLGQDAFLQLLLSELQNQDPTQPMDDTQFISQLATFSSLQTLNHIDASMTAVESSLQTLNQLVAGKLASSSTPTPTGGSQ